jgi:protein-tyrosine phosphatase
MLLRRGEAEEQESPLGPLPGDLARNEVAVTVDSLRDWRGALIQTPEQLELVYTLSKGASSM